MDEQKDIDIKIPFIFTWINVTVLSYTSITSNTLYMLCNSQHINFVGVYSRVKGLLIVTEKNIY